MVMGGLTVMQYTLDELINQYSLLGIPIIILVIGALASRWGVFIK